MIFFVKYIKDYIIIAFKIQKLKRKLIFYVEREKKEGEKIYRERKIKEKTSVLLCER
jgi:hypothetical protein